MDLEYIFRLTGALLSGAGTTLWLFAIVLVLSIPIGFIITLLLRCKIKPLRWLVNAYVYVVRGTPLLLQLLVVYFGTNIIFAGIFRIDREDAAALAFVLNYSAYFAEIFRGGLLAIDKGQYEACKVLGLNKLQTNIHVIIPQMFRVSLPSVTNEAITLVKDTALLYAVSVPEILHYAKAAVVRDSDMTAFAIAAVIYLVMNTIFTLIFTKIEKKMSY
ncbi:MAG: amino acid ABC transporter permease [Oscillospiraceae bacterium]